MEIITLVYDKRNAAIAVAFLAVLGIFVALLTCHVLDFSMLSYLFHSHCGDICLGA